TGSAGTTARVPAPKGVAAESVMLVGLGDFDAASEDVAATHEALRRAAGAALRALDGVETIALALPTATAAEVDAVTVGAGRGDEPGPRPGQHSPARPLPRVLCRDRADPGQDPQAQSHRPRGEGASGRRIRRHHRSRTGLDPWPAAGQGRVCPQGRQAPPELR